MKGGTIIIGGDAGAFTGFMMQRGRIIICGDVGPNLADSLYDGTIFVGGNIKSLGAEIIRTRTEASHDEDDSNFGIAKKLNEEIPNSHILDQWENPCNPEAHYKYTSQEILDDFGTDLDMVVMGVGTGGTITGVGKRLKESIPDIQIVGVDPYGSIL